MAAWEDGYVAASLHDLGKLLLNNTCSKQSGTWSPNHERLDDLSERLSLAQGTAFAHLGTPPAVPFPREEMLRLACAHGDIGDGALRKFILDHGLAAPALALQFADRAHKALYFLEEGGGEIAKVNWHRPWFYPFWGERQRWDPESAAARFLQVTARLQEQVEAGAGFDPKFVVALGQQHLRDFGDSTFLPITSLHFHHQLTAAIYCMVMKSFAENPAIPAADDGEHPSLLLGLNLTRTVLTLPPERLRYRVRDASHLRKISRYLLARLHHHLAAEYLSNSPPDGSQSQPPVFARPEHSPLVFYGKEAIVIIHRAQDYNAIARIAEEVAVETDTPIFLSARPAALAPPSGKPTPPAQILELTPEEAIAREARLGQVRASAGEEHTTWLMPSPAPPVVGAHECACCHKPIPDGQQESDFDDALCKTCYSIRRAYRECGSCSAMFAGGSHCPFCGSRSLIDPPSAGRLVEGQEGRLAIFALRIGATPSHMLEESELRLAQFRAERLAGEKAELEACTFDPDPSAQATIVSSRLAAAEAHTPLVHGTGGPLEYLQAVLEISARQQAWQEWLATALYEGERDDRHHPLDQAGAHFLYRSPLLTVLLLPEELARDAYRRISADLKDLHLAHRLDIITCDSHYPFYQALAHIFDGPGRTLGDVARPPEVRATAAAFHREASQCYREWLVAGSNDETAIAQHGRLARMHQDLHVAATRPASQGLRLVVMRGGGERTFEGPIAEAVLSWQPHTDRDRTASQLSALAEVAAQLYAMAPADGGSNATAFYSSARSSLLLEVDSREANQRIGASGVQTIRRLVSQVHDRRSLAALSHFLREVAAHSEAIGG